ncbi:MAG: glycosyltransferase family 2 protein [Acidimicrobiales bacterium]
MIDPRRVSVVMTVWNGERYIGEALASVAAQTHPAHEVIVNDDGSSDGTVAVVEAFGEGVTLLRSPHEGIAAGRNRALERVTGDVVALLDADDVWLPEKLAVQLAALSDDLDAVFGRTDEFLDLEGVDLALRAPKVGVTGPVVSNLLIRADVVGRIGPFRTDTAVGDWLDWWGRAMRLGVRTSHLPQTLARRRLHSSNNGLRHATERSDYLRVVRDRLRAQRGET